MRERILFNDKWLFYNQDIEIKQPPVKGPSYLQAKTERHLGGPASRLFPDDYSAAGKEQSLLKWDTVTLPHDYILNEPYDENLNDSWGFKNYHPAWYRKHFTVSSEDKNRRLVLYFEGIADHADVYVNGSDMIHTYESHTSFEVDITDFVRFDQDNVIAIRVECGTGEGWWYQGGGIYRNVWLEKYDDLAVERYGVYAAPLLPGKDGHDLPEEGEEWQLPIEAELRNNSLEARCAGASFRVLDPSGTEVASAVTETVCIPARSNVTVKASCTVKDPERWDITSPNLYTVETSLIASGEVCDTVTTTIGFRTTAFDAVNGFFLNGKNVKIKGVCGHGDYGLTGRAVADSVYRYKAKLIKEMGANAYRCSHYPQAEVWMDEMDRRGILVMNEVRWFNSTPDGIREMQFLMKRDRNRPSIIMWSMGNEEPLFVEDQGRRIFDTMYTEAKKLDAYRPIIVAVSHDPVNATVYAKSDIAGINYNLRDFDEIHAKYPDKPIFSSENTADGTSRGWYEEPSPELGRRPAWDNLPGFGFMSHEITWKYIADRPWLAGGMQWIAFEHRGEATWPRVCSISGATDLYLLKKDVYYQNQSFWVEEPMIHVLPHWNLPHKLGRKVTVHAYTNCEEAELFLNGESLGRKKVEWPIHVEWDVVYAPGKLEVVGYVGGQEAVRDCRETTGRPVSLKLTAENADDIARGEVLLLKCTALDSEGREVPDAAPEVTFFANESGMILGTGSDNTDHVVPKIPTRKMYAGAIAVAVQTLKKDEKLTVTAVSDGLIGAVYEF